MKRLKFDNPLDCAGCGACVSICPRHCIEIVKDDLEFNIARLEHPELCIDCGMCYKVCPQIKHRDNQKLNSVCVYGQSKLSDQLLESSSGGLFSLLASHILDKGGIVWGVELQRDGWPSFTCIYSKNDLWKIRGSKYSEVKEPLNFQLIKKQIKEGKLVLVSGTPCQITALRNFLRNVECSNLILIDLLCYGIQSPKMWHFYLKDINPKGKNISRVSMRNKHYSWFNYSMKISFEDGFTYRKIRYKDPWLLTYSTSMFNRLSCSNCQSKKTPHASDFTIGDFWDIDYYKTSLNISKRYGISLGMLHTSKAIELFSQIKDDFIFDYIPKDYMDRRNISLTQSAKVNPLRESFIGYVYNFGFSAAVEHYMDSGLSVWYKKRKNYLRRRTVDKIKSFVKKIIHYKNED